MMPEQNASSQFEENNAEPLLLKPEDNLFNQECFLTLPKQVEAFMNILKPGKQTIIDPKKMGAFVYYFMTVPSNEIMTCPQLRVKTRSVVNWTSGLIGAAQSTKEFLLAIPTMTQYLDENLTGIRRYSIEGLLYKHFPNNRPAMKFTEFQRIRQNGQLTGFKEEFQRRR